MFRTILVRAIWANQKVSCVCVGGGVSSTIDNIFWQRFISIILFFLLLWPSTYFTEGVRLFIPRETIFSRRGGGTIIFQGVGH